MQDIGEALGLLKGSLYYHIESKDQVLFELLTESVTDVHRRVEAAAKTTSEPATRLRAVVQVEVLAMADHLDEISIWHAEGSRLQSEFPEIARTARAVDRILLRVLEDGQKHNAWSLSNPTLAFLAIRDMTASFVTWFDPRGAITIDEVADACARYALHIVFGETEHIGARGIGHSTDQNDKSCDGRPASERR